MSTILDYLDWRGDLTLKQSPFCEVDNLIISILSYMDLSGIAEMKTRRSGITLSEAVDAYFKKHDPKNYKIGALFSDDFPLLFKKAAESRRFGKMKLFGYVSILEKETETQFAALSVDLGDGSVFVSFSGTDDTLVGWKENFNMSYMDSIPAQRHALDYLCSVAYHTLFKIRVGGHSKGGNLSLYAAAKAPKHIKRRIINVYNNDGPGFGKSLEHSDIEDRILTVVPSFSVVGLLLEHGKVDKVVKSNGNGVWQHDPCTWDVCGDRFVLSDGLTKESSHIEKTLKACVAEMTIDERRDMVEALYKVFTANRAETLSDIAADKLDFILSLGKLDEKTRNIIISTAKLIWREGMRIRKEEKKPIRIFKKGEKNADTD